MEQSPRTDGWIMYIYEEFLDILVMEPMIDSAGEFRAGVVESIAMRADRLYSFMILKLVEGHGISESAMTALLRDYGMLRAQGICSSEI